MPLQVQPSRPVPEPRSYRGESAIFRMLEQARQATGSSQSSCAARQPRRVLMAQVFTDIVSSTETLARIGDQAWSSLLQEHCRQLREQLKAFRGRKVDAAGDGFFLVFPCPTLAVQFALAFRASTLGLGLDLRIGIHAGECEVLDGRVQGIAVHTAARIAHAAAPGEILVSDTARSLMAGSGQRFGNASLQPLRGLAAPQWLFAVEDPEERPMQGPALQSPMAGR